LNEKPNAQSFVDVDTGFTDKQLVAVNNIESVSFYIAFF
jgi:hypothetical protein